MFGEYSWDAAYLRHFYFTYLFGFFTFTYCLRHWGQSVQPLHNPSEANDYVHESKKGKTGL